MGRPFVWIAVALLVLACGCSTPRSDAPRGAATPRPRTASATSAASVTATPEIVSTSSMQPSLKHLFTTVDEMAASPDVEVIVRGRVRATRPLYAGYLPWTILTLDVTKAYKGAPANVITVYEDGGLVPLKDVLPELEGKPDVPDYTDEQIATGVIDMRMMDAPHSEPGQELILFLMKNPNADFAGSYMVVSSMYGRFTHDEQSGHWERLALEPAPLGKRFESTKSAEAMEAALAKVK